MTGHSKKILLTVDSKWRDLPAYILLKGIIEKKYGHKVYVLPMGSERYHIPFLKPDIVIFNHLLEKQKEELAKQLKMHNIAVGILPTEGAPISDVARKVVYGVYHDYKDVDLHFTWNDSMKELMLENNVLTEEKIKVIGVPRFDFYRPPANEVLIPKTSFLKKYGLNINFPVVTLATNFISAKFTGSSRFLLKDAESLRTTKALNINERMDWCEKEFSTREGILSIFEKLASNLPQVNFLLKHHPMEDIRFYKKYGKTLRKNGMRNVRIISKHHIWDVLNATDILMQRSCTTAAEAWMMNIPTIQLQLSDHYCDDDHLLGNEIVHSYDEAFQTVNKYLKGEKIPSDILDTRIKTLGKMFFKVDGRSSERCAMYLNEFLASRKIGPETTATAGDFLKLVKYSMKIFIRNVLYSLPYVFTLFHNKLGNMDKRVRGKDIKFWEKKISSITDKYIVLDEK